MVRMCISTSGGSLKACCREPRGPSGVLVAAVGTGEIEQLLYGAHPELLLLMHEGERPFQARDDDTGSRLLCANFGSPENRAPGGRHS